MKRLMFYRPAIASFLIMMATALQSTGLSFFVTPVSAELGVGRSSFTLYYSILSAVGAVAAPFIGRFVGKYGVKVLLLVSSIWTCFGFWAFSISSQLWMFYAIAFAIGATTNVSLMVISNVILQKAYDSQTVSKLLGLVMAGSGFGGMLLSSFMPHLMENIGWKTGYRTVGMLWLSFCIAAFLILGKDTSCSEKQSAQSGETFGMTKEQAMHSPMLYLVLLEMFILATSCGVLQHLPSLLAGAHFDTMQIGAMMSLTTAMLALGKIGQSILYGKVGVSVGGVIITGCFMLGILMLLQPALIYFGLVLLAIGMGAYTTLMPLLVRYVFGSYDFAAIWGLMQAAGAAGGFIGAPAWGAAYDISGSYLPALIIVPILLMVSIAIHLIVTTKKK